MSKVAVLRTSPPTVLRDYQKLMHLAGYRQVLNSNKDLLLKLNLSWTKFYPACSTPPWELEGVVKTLLEDGFSSDKIIPVENKTVVTNPRKGAVNNRWEGVFGKYGLRFQPLTEVEWIKYKFKSHFLKIHKIFPGGIYIPQMFVGKQIVHLPTVKTHGHSTTTGAIKNSFGGLLKEVRHYCHKYIHEVLVDLVLMQKELHPGIFVVMDGTVAGDGAGPRTMVPKVKNVILAGSDSVAVDAVAAKIMGFDPLKIPYLKMCHERGLGVADVSRVEVVGDRELVEENWGFRTKKSLVIWGDQMLRRGGLRFLEKIALHSPLWRWAPIASNLYHDWFWYPVIGQRYIREFMKTGWGELFGRY
ncbi:iron-sulfur cluster-binding protein [candidate division CPR3 bacterium 4484_211]|uniref:Iron-sulfur cluster-binding protein n=1 Tax=candidate division CPR3 bacterium 4484_211 TaxID=1968527 RepID=A0A1W9NZK7_UNCC3|nr:MAG: iron-sulfur cluster-binding protein [candidate division CPR3 bacterium 4484_211]